MSKQQKKQTVEPSNETKLLVDEFEAADQEFQEGWNEFYQQHYNEFQRLEALMESRNGKLEKTVHAMRGEAFEADTMTTHSVKYGPLQLIKKWSDFFNPEAFVKKLEEKKLYDQALKAGVVSEEVKINFNAAKTWLEANNLERDFENCEDGKENTPSLAPKSPKALTGWGTSE